MAAALRDHEAGTSGGVAAPAGAAAHQSEASRAPAAPPASAVGAAPPAVAASASARGTPPVVPPAAEVVGEGVTATTTPHEGQPSPAGQPPAGERGGARNGAAGEAVPGEGGGNSRKRARSRSRSRSRSRGRSPRWRRSRSRSRGGRVSGSKGVGGGGHEQLTRPDGGPDPQRRRSRSRERSLVRQRRMRSSSEERERERERRRRSRSRERRERLGAQRRGATAHPLPLPVEEPQISCSSLTVPAAAPAAAVAAAAAAAVQHYHHHQQQQQQVRQRPPLQVPAHPRAPADEPALPPGFGPSHSSPLRRTAPLLRLLPPAPAGLQPPHWPPPSQGVGEWEQPSPERRPVQEPGGTPDLDLLRRGEETPDLLEELQLQAMAGVGLQQQQQQQQQQQAPVPPRARSVTPDLGCGPPSNAPPEVVAAAQREAVRRAREATTPDQKEWDRPPQGPPQPPAMAPLQGGTAPHARPQPLPPHCASTLPLASVGGASGGARGLGAVAVRSSNLRHAPAATNAVPTTDVQQPTGSINLGQQQHQQQRSVQTREQALAALAAVAQPLGSKGPGHGAASWRGLGGGHR